MSEENRQENQQENTQASQQAQGAVDSEIQVNEVAEEPKKGPLATLSDIEAEVEKAFERFFRGSWLPSLRELPPFPALRESFESRVPKVDVIDHDDTVVVEAELPGVSKPDIEVSVSSDSVTIKAKTARDEESAEGDYHRREISRGYFSRTVTLPGTVDADNGNASFEDGLLTVTLPKSEVAKRQAVEIN